MKNINIIANNVVLLSEHIIETLKDVEKTSNFKNVISDCIIYHKDCAGIEKYYLYSPNNEWLKIFYLELTFHGRDNVIIVKFANTTYSPEFKYKASLEKYIIIVNKPLYSYIDGIIYCGIEHNFLYIDQFSNREPVRPKKIVINDLLYGKQDGYNRIECSDFISFYERLNNIEKNQIGVVDVDLYDMDDWDSRFVDYVRRSIINGNISCLIKPNALTRTIIDKWGLSDKVIITGKHEKLSTLTKEQWLKKALSIIESYYLYNYTGNDCYNSIINFIIDHEVPGNVVYNLILEVISSESIKKHRLDCRLENIKRIL